MGEAVVVHGPGVSRQLPTDVIDPGTVCQFRVMPISQRRQVFGARQLAGDHRPTVVGRTATFQAPGHHFGGRDAPLGEALEVLPFGFHPRLAQITAQAFAGTDVTFDVIVHAVAVDADDLG